MSVNSVKLSIQLSNEQIGSLPVEIEHLWFDKENDYYRLKNIPQFVDELSYDDLVKVRKVDGNSYVIEQVKEFSQNSTIWILAKNGADLRDFLESIKSLSCGIEGGALDGYYAINIPHCVDIEQIYSLIDSYENSNILVADYPSIRHE
ncbi:DUF4265 domain-containing protein [Thalassotalea ganghwensis]